MNFHNYPFKYYFKRQPASCLFFVYNIFIYYLCFNHCKKNFFSTLCRGCFFYYFFLYICIMALGRPRKIESPEKLYEYFLSYEEETKAKPFLIKDWVGKDAFQVDREKERPLTMEGFECWLFDKGVISDLGGYIANSNGAYSDFSTICTHIRKKIRQDQIEGGMAGQYNPSITQRLNSLVEKTEDVTQEPRKIIVKIKRSTDENTDSE